MNMLLRRVGGVATAISITACASSKGSASADSVRLDSTHVAASTAAVPDSLRSGTTVVMDAAQPASTTLPKRTSVCGGPYVNVKIKASALGNSSDAAGTAREMRTISTDLLAPVRAQVGGAAISPAIRTFRVSVHDSSQVQSIMSRLRESPQVERVSADICQKAIE